MKKLIKLFNLVIFLTTFRVFSDLGREDVNERIAVFVMVFIFFPLFLTLSNHIKFFANFLDIKIFLQIFLIAFLLINVVNLDSFINLNFYLILSSVYTVVMMISVIYFIKKESKKSNQYISEGFLYLYSLLFLILQIILVLGKHFNLKVENILIVVGMLILFHIISSVISSFIISENKTEEIQELK